MLSDKISVDDSQSPEGFISQDRRGKAPPKNKTSEEVRAFEKTHTESYPAVESHYCRKRTSRKYLDHNLSVKKMHEQNTDLCKKESRNPAKIHIYRDIFNTDYNYGFHKLKKDECSPCDTYKASTEEKAKLNNEYEAHKTRKMQSRQRKESDKQKAIENPAKG